MIDKRRMEVVLTDQKEEIELRSAEKLCNRKEEGLIELESPQAQVIIGVRRSGKSTLCYQQLVKSGITFAYVNFDDELFNKATSDDLNDVLEVLYKIYGKFQYLFLDEIQNIEGWHLFVNRLLRRQMHILLTGSNAKLLSGELATHLTGRSKEISLYPFSFMEYCEMSGVDIHSKTTLAEALRRKSFDEYLMQGGFPEMLKIKDKRAYIKDLVENILKRDIEERYQIRFTTAFEELAHHLLNISPTKVSESELAKLFGFKSEHTVKNYIDYLKQSYLFVGLNKYSAKSKMRIAGVKLYPIDVALMNNRDNAFVGDNLGWRLESIVYIHLLRKCKMEGLDIYYLQDRSGECDFLVCRNNVVIQAVQVSYDISNEKTKKREVAGLLLAARKTKCTNLLLLTDSVYDTIEVNGYEIKVQPVYDWALEIFS